MRQFHSNDASMAALCASWNGTGMHCLAFESSPCLHSHSPTRGIRSFRGPHGAQTALYPCGCTVYMGQGEPCLTWRAVLASAQFINTDIGVGARHITVSTVGVPNSMRLLAAALKECSLQLTLAVSIHAPSQEVREKIVPR